MSKIIRHNQTTLSPEIIEPLYKRASSIIEDARVSAYRLVNESLVRRNWELGKIIAEEEFKGEDRAKYGAAVIKELSKRLTSSYGKGFSKSYLYSFVQFYKTHPTIFQSMIGKSANLLSWTHYFILNQELNDDARKWYESVILWLAFEVVLMLSVLHL